MPENFTKGLDVSHWSGHVNWLQVKNESDIAFAIVKATEGIHYIDETFDTNWSRIRQFDLIRGVYHFFVPKTNPIAQANHFLRVVGEILHATDFPPIVDIEYYPQYIRDQWDLLALSTRINRIQQCLDRLERDTGRLPIIYTSQSSWISIMENSTVFTRYPLWIANYGVQTPNLPANQWSGKKWFLWQYTQSGTVPGINASVDLNWFNGDLDTLKEKIGISGSRPLPPQVTNKNMLEAIQEAAASLNSDINQVLQKTGLQYIKEPFHLNRPYDGPGIEEMSLTAIEKDALIDALASQESDTPSGLPAWFTNQDMIDAFYSAANKLFIDGWTLIERARLANLADDRGALYTGVRIEDMELSVGEKIALAAALGIEVEAQTTTVVSPTYPGLTNQDMINAIYKAAIPSGDDYWEWAVRAGLTHISSNRNALYIGPTIDEMTLNQMEKQALKDSLGADPVTQPPSSPYPGFTNQDIINVFFQAADPLGVDFWEWVDRAGLQSMAIPTENRTKLYSGPKIEDLPNLTNVEKNALLNAF